MKERLRGLRLAWRKEATVFTHNRKFGYFCKAWNVSEKCAKRLKKEAEKFGFFDAVIEKGWSGRFNCILRIPGYFSER